MSAKSLPNKETGLRHGDAAKIGRIHRVTRNHVIEVAAGRRTGRPTLLDTIRRYQERAKLATQEAA